MTGLSGAVELHEPAPGTLRSSIYEGTVTHHRIAPIEHRFRYRVAMVAVDLSEVDALCRLHPLWSNERRNAVSFRRADYLGPVDVPLETAVRDLVEGRTGRRPSGPVLLLTYLRTWGWLFNPISLYYCYGDQPDQPEAVVAEVANTPWHERTAYVLQGTGRTEVAKDLHVSPFLPMDLSHRFTPGVPGDHLVVQVDDVRAGETVFTASMALRRTEASRQSLGAMLWSYPLMTVRVSAGIYRQALTLRRKGAPFHPHPDKAPLCGR